MSDKCARCGKRRSLAPDGTCWSCAVAYRDDILNDHRLQAEATGTLADLVNAAHVYANVVEERYAGRTGWASASEARSLFIAAIDAAEVVLSKNDGLEKRTDSKRATRGERRG